MVSDPIVLPTVNRKGQLSVEEALGRRRSIREFSTRSITLHQVAQILWSVYGVSSEGGLRTTPSAGAIYPMEVYIQALRVEALEVGLYRYHSSQVDEGLLFIVRRGDLSGDIVRAAWDQEWMKMASAIVILAGNMEKMATRYGRRAERYVYMEAGHAAQNLHLQAVALGMRSVPVAAFDDRSLQTLLNTHAQPLYILPFGF